MKGVILSRCPQANIVDISHEIDPQAILQGAYVLSTAAKYFPPDAIHVAVVDPGVGSDRRPIAVQTSTGTFVAPDNGILSLALREYIPAPSEVNSEACPPDDHRWTLLQAKLPDECRGVVLDEPSFWLPNVSRTFHGRDVFAPAAAHIASGRPVSDLGSPAATIGVFPSTGSKDAGGACGTVVHIDRYGNLITDIPSEFVPDGAGFEVAGHRVAGLIRSYSEAVGRVLAIVGSQGTVEIAVGNGNAAETLGAGIGDTVTIVTEAS